MLEALTYLATKRRKPVTRADFDKLFPGQFADLYRVGYIFDWRDMHDHQFRVGITDTGRNELRWRTL